MTRGYHLPCPGAALRAAIAINNIGCSLLERGCHSPAQPTLKDAAQAMVLLLLLLLGGDGDGAGNGANQEERGALRSVASRLADADRRLASPCEARWGLPPPGGKGPAPIRLTLDAAPPDGGPAPGDLLVMAAIAVHNSALAWFYLSLDGSRAPGERRHLHCKAKVLLRSSYRLLGEAGSDDVVTLNTLAHGVTILENLDAVLRRPPPPPPPPPPPMERAEADRGGDSGRPSDDGNDGGERAAVEAELLRLREVVRAVEGADALYFGRPVGAAAA